MTYLTYVAVEGQLARTVFFVIFGLAFLASIVMLPWGQNEDGSAKRLSSFIIRGSRSATLVTGDKSTSTGVVVASGKSVVNQTGLQITMSELRQQTLDVSRAVVLPEAQTIASEAVRAELDRRLGGFIDKVLREFNETDPVLFNQWDKPRFKAAFISAQNSVLETGDEDLADLQSKLLTALAQQPKIRSRREIFLRQAIDIAPRLSTEHVNALAVQAFFISFEWAEPWDYDWIINALHTFLHPYFGRVPTSSLDYQYMSSTGVCQTGQLGSYSGGPYKVIYDRYPNAMYRAFTNSELEHLLNDKMENPDLKAYLDLLEPYAPHSAHIIKTPIGEAAPVDELQFRLRTEYVATILTQNDRAGKQLPPKQGVMRDLIRQKTITIDDFRSRIADRSTDLATLMNTFEQTGALNFSLQPVGYVIAQHEIGKKNPHIASIMDQALNSGENDDAKPR
ncbi:LPO_1073/Vpar_1526 family protein [Mycolicibacterium murale]|nr:LPO_1073/Vpar_1526 family protein [Mycolicibacterium murale]MCV7185425.1 hypothetical protein [Mycolicibacterium murale]